MAREFETRNEFTVHATPEQVWEAIATGPGITAWFMPAEVDGRVGGTVVHRPMPDMPGAGTVTAYDPPRRFAYEEEMPAEGDRAAHSLATEFLVEARSGGTCVVRVVMSGFGDGDAWERAIESFGAGWRQALLSLRLYLTHFRGEPVGSIAAATMIAGRRDAVWQELTRALGLPAAPEPGARVATTGADVPGLAGAVEDSGDGILTLTLEAPTRGIGLIGVGGPGGDEVFATVRAQLFGGDAAQIAAREQERWTVWFAERMAPAR